MEGANIVKRSTVFEFKTYRKPFKEVGAILAAAVLATAMLAGCKQGDNTVQAVEKETDGQKAGNESTAQAAETDAYTVRDVKVYDEHPTDQTVALRFYRESPHVAYMGIRAYFDLMLGGGLTVTDRGEGLFTLTNANGATAEVDTVKGIVSMEDMPSFDNYLEEAKAGVQSSFKDSPAPYLRLREVVYEDAPAPVSFDLGALGIAIYGDGDDVWFPVSILSSWLTDIAQNRVSYNGVYLCKLSGVSKYTLSKEYFDTEYMDAVLRGEPREEDLASGSYAELGFIFRYMYGYPGTSGLDTSILWEQGLDAALKACGEQGQKLVKELSSRDIREFWHGMYDLSGTVLEDGHNNTALDIFVVDEDETERYQTFREYTWEVYSEGGMTEFEQKLTQANLGIFQVRPEELTKSSYYASGDTAVILLNAFTADRNGWEAYYRGDGPVPGDTYGTVAQGLKKAAEDGQIRNIIFDLSTNSGGYTDAAAACISLMTGRDYLCGYDELSKQHFKVYFDIDRNLDGKIDEKDAEVHYDFNYGALVSNASFSCGNLFPFLVRDEGGVVIGERSGGGSCSVQKAVLSEGFDIRISGCKFKLTDLQNSDLEQGIEPDILLEIPSEMATDNDTGEETEKKDYSVYGDLDKICSEVSEWFHD